MIVKLLLVILIFSNVFSFVCFCVFIQVRFNELRHELGGLKAEIETLIHQLNDEEVKKKSGTTYINFPSGEVTRGF